THLLGECRQLIGLLVGLYHGGLFRGQHGQCCEKRFVLERNDLCSQLLNGCRDRHRSRELLRVVGRLSIGVMPEQGLQRPCFPLSELWRRLLRRPVSESGNYVTVRGLADGAPSRRRVPKLPTLSQMSWSCLRRRKLAG